MHEYHTMNLAKWDLNSSSNYVLITVWRNVVHDNKLEEVVIQKGGKEESIVVMKEDDKLKSDVVVQVWCFRSEGRIWFALNIQAMSECSVTSKTKDGHDIVA
ncbi:hypothetical protein DCAR_0101541 [Daucus carota subsp. sativus]|uniref:Uncharacterized protein n=1 Tax=Daucus carota subsp. sativus TaxID=79200 RepID=A0A166GGT7_DAUCS|nr:hypothetical protein DCAR_0101541 [Daucus carota subsp. sativus]